MEERGHTRKRDRTYEIIRGKLGFWICSRNKGGTESRGGLRNLDVVWWRTWTGKKVWVRITKSNLR